MMVERTYLGWIERGRTSFGIVFPDVPGCVSVGDTMQHVLAMGKDALTFHITSMVEDGEALPIPSETTLEDAQADTPEAQWVAIGAITVEVPDMPGTISIPIATDLVREIDDIAGNRRQFIMDATRRELDRLKKSA